MMKINLKNVANLTLLSFVLVLMASCYKFGRTVAPVEVAGGEPYAGRIVAVNDGNNATQKGLSFFAVRVPENWNVTVAEDAYKQYALPGTKNDEGEEVNRTCAMRYSAILASHLNTSNPKEGYTWFAFQTTECIRRNIQGSSELGCDSVGFDFKVINDGVAGTFELDYMMGTVETEDVNYLENENKSIQDIVGSDIFRVSTEQVTAKDILGDKEFNNIYPEFKTTVKVLEGGQIIDNTPTIDVNVSGATATVNYKNVIGLISVYKNAGPLALPMDYLVEGLQKFNDGQYTLDVANLEPGTYHVRSLTSGAEGTFVIEPREFSAEGTSLLVLGGTNLLAKELLVDENDAYLVATAMEPGMLKESEEIVAKMVETVKSTNPSALLVTGNLTFNGAKLSHDKVAALLKQVSDAGIKVFVVPGPNDVNNLGACKYVGEGTVNVEYISAAEFATMYAGCGYGDAVSRDESTLSYLGYASADLAILAIDACQYANNTIEEGVVTIDGSAVLTTATVEWMKSAVSASRATGRRVIAIMNHAVMPPFNGYAALGNVVNNAEKVDIAGMFGGGTETDGPVFDFTTEEIQNMLASQGVEVVFVGGGTANDIQKIQAANGKDLYQVSTGEAVAYTCPYRLVNLKDNALNIQTRGLSDVEIPGLLMPFEDYAYYRVKTMLPIAVSSWVEKNWEMVNGILQNSFTFPYDPEVDIFNKNDFFKLPETPEEFSKIVNDNVIPPFVNVLLAFVDGNENMKKSQILVDDMHAGWDGFISALNTFPSIINPMVKEGFANAGLDVDAMIDGIVPSIAFNFLGTEDNVCNDLFISIPMADPSGVNAVNTIADGNATYYTISGVKVEKPTVSGVYIKKMADGTAKTVLVK